ncbi:MAG TPA: rhomboid family intramembrane serine protease [Limnochordales bacterium]
MPIIPLRDNIPTLRYPLVNKLLVGANVAVFLYELTQLQQLPWVLQRWGLIPARLWGLAPTGGLDPSPESALALPPAWLTLFTSMFLHAGWVHIGSNMLYLWIFGDNVEDRLGHLRYFLFYLLVGAVAGLMQAALSPYSVVPTVGASGAVAGVLGAYLLLYPWARISTLVPVLFFLTVLDVPAWLFLALWFLLQLWNGALSIAADPSVVRGVAWWAHIGGFVAGVLLLRWWKVRRRPAVPPW